MTKHEAPHACLHTTRLNLDLAVETLLLLALICLGLGTHDTTTPVFLGLLMLVKISLLDSRDEFGKLRLVFAADLSDGEGGGSLLVHNSSETGLALDDRVRDAHLSAQSREEDDKLDGVHIVRDEHESGLLGLDQSNDMVQAILDGEGLLADILLLLALSDSSGLLTQTLLLLGLGLRAVLVEELEGLGGGVAVKGVVKLGDRRGHLEAQVQDLALALKADILRPSHHAREVALGLDVLADTEVAGAALEQRVLCGLLTTRASLGGRERGRCGLLARCFRGLSLRRTISRLFNL